MAARLSIRTLQRVAVQTQRSTTVRVPSTFSLSRNASSSTTTSSSTANEEGPSNRKTHFGYETVTEEEKTERVAGVFTSVAESYDKMNDLMSFGWHRVWKDQFISSLSHGLAPTTPPSSLRILDVAGGTGDIAFRLLRHAIDQHTHPSVTLTVSDINPSMLSVGKSRSLSLPPAHQAALSFLTADATSFDPILVPDNSVDLYTVAFGIRNFTNIPLALREAHRVLKPGGVFACLEFSSAEKYGLLNAVYKRWSFSAIPLIGQVVAGDRDSYQYLVESIERFPKQEAFRDMIVEAGFVVSGEGYENLTGGIAAIHKGMKPIT